MKQNLFLIIWLCCIFNIRGQDQLNKAKLGFDLSMGNNALGRANILPGVTFTKGKHTAFAGPAFIYGIEYNTYRPVYGIQAGYQFFPNGQKNRFNLFFEYDFNYIKNTYKFNYYSAYPSAPVKRAATISCLDNYLSFGFKFNITHAIYLHTNVGLGLIMYKEAISDELSNGQINNYSYSTGLHAWKFYPYNSLYGGYDDISYYPYKGRLIGIFKAGIGINVCSLRKKNK